MNCLYICPEYRLTETEFKNYVNNALHTMLYDYTHIYEIDELLSYKTYKLNSHHFVPTTYFTKIIPDIINSFDSFNENDYKIVRKYDNNNDISYFLPITDYNYTVEIDNDMYDCHYDGLIGFDNLHAKTTYSEYHKIFVGAHSCGKITNNDIKNDRVLLISCDSISIPLIPVLTCYFHKIIFLDNRTEKSYKYLYDNETITDTLYLMFSLHNIEKFIIDNLK